MSDPCTQGLHQLRAVKDEPLEFCLYTQTPSHPPQRVHKCMVNANTHRCTHSHCTSSTQSKDDHGHQPPAQKTKSLLLCSRFRMKPLDYPFFLFCNFEISECMSLYFEDVSEWFNLALLFFFFSTLYHVSSTLGFKFLHHWLLINRTVGVWMNNSTR